MLRVNEPSISVSKKTNEQNISAIKNSLSEIVDVVNLMSENLESIKERVSALESEDE